MKVGDLVKWRHPLATSIGVTVKACEFSCLVHWNDGISGWHAYSDLEVLDESR